MRRHDRPVRFARVAVMVVVVAVVAMSSPAMAAPSQPTPEGERAAALRWRGLEYGFNLDYPEALESFKAALAEDPQDATAARLAAAVIWMQVLLEQGAVTVEDYLGQASANVARRPASPALIEAFNQYLDRATALADARLRVAPGDADAQFQAGAAAGLRASFTATVEGRVRDSVGVARRAYVSQKRCMAIDPRRKDAGLIVGLYQYAIANLSFPMKLLARLAGFEAGRDSGIRLVEEASRYPLNPQTETNALFSLVLLYSREGRHDAALTVIRQLRERYPRNRLLTLEAGSALLRAGRPVEALGAFDEGLRQFAADQRPHAYGEEARWRYLRGSTLVKLRRADAARADLQAVERLDAPPWVHARVQLELGKVSELSGDRAGAIDMYRAANQACRAAREQACADEARKLIGSHLQ